MINEIRIHLPGLVKDNNEPDTYYLTGVEMVDLDYMAIVKDLTGHGIPRRVVEEGLEAMQHRMLADIVAKKMTRA
jgi:predicted GNAT family acetyltransferase